MGRDNCRIYPPGKGTNYPFNLLLQGEPDLICHHEDACKNCKEYRNAKNGAGENMIDSVGHDNLSHFEPRNGCPGNLFDPVIPAADHSVEGVFMLDEKRLYPVPHIHGQKSFHHLRYFRIAFHELRSSPVDGERRWDVVFDEIHETIKNRPVIRGNIRYAGFVIQFPSCRSDDSGYEFLDAPVFSGDHRHDRYPQRFLQRLHINVNPLSVSNIDHIDGYNNRGT